MTERIPYPSSSSNKTYHVTIANDGTMSCDCRGWTMKKEGQERGCTHTKQEAAKRLDDTPESDAKFLGITTKELKTGGKPWQLRDVDAGTYTIGTEVGAGYVSPMLATPLDSGMTLAKLKASDYWQEEKFDGHRVIVSVADGTVTAWSRPRAGAKGQGLRRDLPEHIVQVLQVFPNGTFDGELVSPDGKAWNVVNLDVRHLLKLVLFDVLIYKGESLMGKPAIFRRGVLDGLGQMLHLHSIVPVAVAERGPVSADAIEAIWKRGGEGVILKRNDSIYRPGHRSPDWIKIKRLESMTMTIIGFKPGKFGPCSTVLLKGAGIVTSVKTLDNEHLRLFGADPASFVGRQLRIEHQGIFSGKLRHPMFDHLVEEKK